MFVHSIDVCVKKSRGHSTEEVLLLTYTFLVRTGALLPTHCVNLTGLCKVKRWITLNNPLLFIHMADSL